MIEVEVRAKVSNPSEIKKGLDKINAKFLRKEKQVDRVFLHPVFLDSQKKVLEKGFSARIREIDDKITLEFKEIVRKGGGVELKSELKDLNAGLRLLKGLGWNEAFTVAKSREVYSYKDFEICLDNVEKLGSFIEVEKTLTSSEEKENARKECLDLLSSIYPNFIIEDSKYGDLMVDFINNQNKVK